MVTTFFLLCQQTFLKHRTEEGDYILDARASQQVWERFIFFPSEASWFELQSSFSFFSPSFLLFNHQAKKKKKLKKNNLACLKV